MDTRICWIYCEQELTPRAIEVIRDIKKENGYEDVRFLDVSDPKNGRPGPGSRVLVFGSTAPSGVWEGVEFIHTYSVAQIMAKPNAATVLTSGLQLYFNGRHVVPDFIRPIGFISSASTPSIIGYNYDAPTAIDIETSGNLGKTHTPEEVEIISVALYQEGCVPIVYHNMSDDASTSDPLHPRMLAALARELPKFTKAIYHNGKFDTRILNRVLGVKLCVWFDTMLAHHVLNHAAGDHKLKHLAQRYLGAPEWEAELSKYTKGGGHYELIPPHKLVEYNGWDVYWTFQLWKLFAPQIESDEDNQKALLFEMSVADMLLDVEMAGIPFDAESANLLLESNEQEMAVTLAEMRRMSNSPEFNPNSPKQVKDILWRSFNMIVASTNEAALQEIIDTYHDKNVARWCTLLLDYRGMSKQNSTYALGWGKHARKLECDRQKRVRPTFLVHGTSTGRLSSTSPNCQNMPRNKAVRKVVSLE